MLKKRYDVTFHLGSLPCGSYPSGPHRPAAPLFLQEAFGESRSHSHPAAERLWRGQTQQWLWVRRSRTSSGSTRWMWINDSPKDLFSSLSFFFFFFLSLFREFSNALEFLQLLNSCTEDSPSPPPPFSTPPNHTTTPGMNSMRRTTMSSHDKAWITCWCFLSAEWGGASVFH